MRISTVQATARVLATKRKLDELKTPLKTPFPPIIIVQKIKTAAKTNIGLERPWYHMFSSSEEAYGSVL